MSGAESLHELVSLAHSGDSYARNILAAKLATGDGINKNPIGALYWYMEAAKSGYVHAKWNAGSMLVDGEDEIIADEKLAMKLIEEAAAAYENSACLFLAQCYRDGRHGKIINKKMADHWESCAWDFNKFREFDAFKIHSTELPNISPPEIFEQP